MCSYLPMQYMLVMSGIVFPVYKFMSLFSISSRVMLLRSHMPWKMLSEIPNRFSVVSNSYNNLSDSIPVRISRGSAHSNLAVIEY